MGIIEYSALENNITAIVYLKKKTGAITIIGRFDSYTL